MKILLFLTLIAAATNTVVSVPSNNIIYILGAFLGGSAIAGVAAYMRLKKIGPAEKEDLMNQVAARTVEIAETTMKRLENDLTRALRDRDRYSSELIKQVEVRSRLEEQVKELKARVEHLERRLEKYETVIKHEEDRQNSL